MKNILILVLVAFIGGTAVAQNAPSVAKVASAEKFDAGKMKGTYVFEMPATCSAEQIKKAASYYTQYFTVNFDAKTKDATINMIKNDNASKHVIVRFLVANGVKEVNMDGKTTDVETFFRSHIN